MFLKNILLIVFAVFSFLSITTFSNQDWLSSDNKQKSIKTSPSNNSNGQQFRQQKFFAGSNIKAVLTDSDNVIWVSASNNTKKDLNGLFRLDPKSITWVHVNNKFSLDIVSSMTLDSSNDLLIAGSSFSVDGYGLLIKKKGSEIFSEIPSFKNKIVSRIYLDKRGELFAITASNSVYYQKKPSAQWIYRNISNITQPITQFIEISSGDYYLISEYYLWKSTDNWKWSKLNYLNKYVIFTISEGVNNGIYLGTQKSGLLKIDPNSEQITNISNFSNQAINWLYLDAKNILWVSSYETVKVAKNEKYNRFYLSQLKNESTKITINQFQEFEQNSILANSMMIDNNGNYWVGTQKNGIFLGCWNTTKGYYVKYKKDSGICILDPTKTYNEIFSTGFQIIINDPRVKEYVINGKKYKYNDKLTIVNFSTSKTGNVKENYLIKFQIIFSQDSINNISQKYIIKSKFNEIGSGKTEDINDIIQFVIGVKKTVDVKYKTPSAEEKRSTLIYALANDKLVIEPLARLIITVLNGFLLNYQNSAYDEISYQGTKANVLNTYSMKDFKTTKPEIPPAQKNGIYQFNLVDLVKNKCTFLLQVGGKEINPNLEVIRQNRKSWFFSSAVGIFVFIIIIFAIISAFDIAFILYWRSKQTKNKNEQKTSTSRTLELLTSKLKKR